MTTGLKVIKSISMTDAMLTATNVPENEHPTYNAGATYASGPTARYRRLKLATEHHRER
jgi:hypothetical protein